MESMPLSVQMLGKFSLQLGSSCVSDSDNRSKKSWLLLAYMIYYRNRPIPPEEFISLLWGDDEKSSNPLNALKTMSHRIRSTLEQLGSGTGHQLILRHDTTYAWNTDVPIILDVDEFDRLCQCGYSADSDDEKLAYWQQALALYKGDFLSKLSSEFWVIPIAAHYHNLYVQTVLEMLPILERRGQWQEAAEVCRAAIEQDPYLEDFYRHQMRAMIELGDRRGAVAVYENMSKLFLRDFGAMPSEDIRAIYRDALRSLDDCIISSDMLLDRLREPDDEGGALICDYDIFQSIYHTMARGVIRSGDAIHLALISIQGEDGKTLSRRSLDRVVENLQTLIRTSLRRGDIAARCSVSQFVLMLPQANYENSCMVCERIVKAFARQYPHSPATLHVSVRALEPNS